MSLEMTPEEIRAMHWELVCPNCKEEDVLWRESVDVGVGVMYGPYGCPCCGWSEDSQFDSSQGKSPAQIESPNMLVDSAGGMISKEAVGDKLEHFGIDRKVLDKL